MTDCIATFTGRSVPMILEDGGSRRWKLDQKRAAKCAYVVLCRNRKAAQDWAPQPSDLPETHGSAFMVGKLSEVVPDHDGPDARWLLRFSEYARIDVPDAWKGWRTPVRYLALEDFGIDVGSLEFQPMPNGSGLVQPTGGMTSSALQQGRLYTRADLRAQFGIIDSTINNGVFQPKSTSSVWLFVTRLKTKDRTQYEDRLEGDVLHWQGQKLGRTDPLIIEHEQRGLELLLFYRESKLEHRGAAFRYEGRFRYLRHSGSSPTDFVLGRLSPHQPLSGEVEVFDPNSVEDGRQKIMAAIHRRQGQGAFRRAVLAAYGGRCALSECPVEAVLEAAHVYPYLGPKTNNVTNGLLLRADLHTLFDLGRIAIDTATMTTLVAADLMGTEYQKLAGQKLRLPAVLGQRPSVAALDKHRRDMFDERKVAVPVPA